jgi:hypothetical protein
MTIWMITREFEYESGGGRTWYEPMADVDLGYFISKEAAELKLADLWDEEKDAYARNFQRTAMEPWRKRKAEHERISFQNAILKENGIADSSLTPVPHVWDEPVMKPWRKEMSSYAVVEIEPGAV